jgi:hypothetical protein
VLRRLAQQLAQLDMTFDQDPRTAVAVALLELGDGQVGSPQVPALDLDEGELAATAQHHLFYADLAVRESGMEELLPTVRVFVEMLAEYAASTESPIAQGSRPKLAAPQRHRGLWDERKGRSYSS